MKYLPVSMFLAFLALGGLPFAATGNAQSTRLKPISLHMIFFDLNGADVSQSALSIVNQVVERFKSKQPILIEVEGHTDMSAVETADKNLAQARADGIRDALVAKGLPRTVISAIAVGSSSPMVKTPKGTREPLNRRVVITLYAISDVPVAVGSRKPVPECMDFQSRGDQRVVRNTCKVAINVQTFDRDKQAVVEQELRPNQEVPTIPGGSFVAVCPAKHRSDISLTPDNAAVFGRQAYYCIVKSGGLY